MMVLTNHATLKPLRRELRRNQTHAERRLWQRLRNKQLNGLKFFRQYSLGSYILDFYCPQTRLAIELDGGQHAAQVEYDKQRTAYLERHDITVLRFWNPDVLHHEEDVLATIWHRCSENIRNSP